MVVFKFLRSENLSNNIADSVTLSGPERQERLSFSDYLLAEMLFVMINLNSRLILILNYLTLIMRVNKSCLK